MSSFDYFLFDCSCIIIEAASHGCGEDFISVSTLGEDSHFKFVGGEKVHVVLDDAFRIRIYSIWILKHGPYVVVGADNDFGVYSVALVGVDGLP